MWKVESDNSSLVSIPQGTIKSHRVSKFTMHRVVSIPQGTIKSSSSFRKRRVEHVSIPQGTIKSVKFLRNIVF